MRDGVKVLCGFTLFMTVTIWVVFTVMRAGEETGIRVMQRKAVANGAAEWVIQPETGETTFRWKGAADGTGK